MLANPAPQFHVPATAMEQQLSAQQCRAPRKRRAETQPENNERLSKRMSLLNLEQSGTKLYIPVESQQPPSIATTTLPSLLSADAKPTNCARLPSTVNDDASMMQLDDSKYKVYIRNLDDELASDSETEDGAQNLIFLPDIEKHLRTNRIPPAVLAQPDPDMLNKQLVLYSVPSSISVPEEHDSVRKAIIEARMRLREKQGAGCSDFAPPSASPLAITLGCTVADGGIGSPNGFYQGIPTASPPMMMTEGDVDAMELD